MAKGERQHDKIDPGWPEGSDHSHPVTELATEVTGALSPYGDIEFPLEKVAYEHPHTVLNK